MPVCDTVNTCTIKNVRSYDPPMTKDQGLEQFMWLIVLISGFALIWLVSYFTANRKK